MIDDALPQPALLLELAVAAAMMALMTLIHGLGIVGIWKLLDLRDERLEEHDFNFRAILLMCAIALSLFVLHTIEIWLFAGLYLALGLMHTLEEALFYSASAYATLGRTEAYFPHSWRLLGAVEALIGFLLIGWSTAVLVRNVGKLTPR